MTFYDAGRHLASFAVVNNKVIVFDLVGAGCRPSDFSEMFSSIFFVVEVAFADMNVDMDGRLFCVQVVVERLDGMNYHTS